MSENPAAIRRRVQPSGKSEQRKLIKIRIPNSLNIVCMQAPGDLLMVTSAVRDLKRIAPKMNLGLLSRFPELWENNPHVKHELIPDAVTLQVNYRPYLQSSYWHTYHFVTAIHKFLEDNLGIRVPCTCFSGDIHLSEEEVQSKPIIDEPYWILLVGGKTDFTTKWWNPDHAKAVVDHFKNKITFIQVGADNKNPDTYPQHVHFPIDGAMNMIGKTSIRDMVRLTYHSEGVLCPITFAMHLAAAVPVKPGKRKLRPAVITAGGREPPSWEAYPGHRFIHNIGQLDCCEGGPCFARRAQLCEDKTRYNTVELCKHPVKVRDDLAVPMCLDMIKPKHVIEAIESYYVGNIPLPCIS